MSKTRLAAVPDLPTVDEAGIRALSPAMECGLGAEGTPHDETQSGSVRAMADPSVRQRLADLGQTIYLPTSKRPRPLPHSKGRNRKVGTDHRIGNIKVE